MNDATIPAVASTIPALLFSAARHHAARAALEEPGRRISYAELPDQALAVSRALLAHGIQPGDKVAIWAPNCIDWVLAALGIHCAGAVMVPINTRMKGAEAADILARSHARLLFCVGTFLGTDYPALLAPVRPACVEKIVLLGDGGSTAPCCQPWADFLAGGSAVSLAQARARAEAVRPDDIADLMFTSGTTGKPKGVQRDVGGYAVAMAQSMRTVFDCQPGQVMFSTSDVGWAVGHSYNVYGPLIGGCTSLLYEGLPTNPDPGIWWALCEQYGVRTMFSSPTAIRVLKKSDVDFIRRHDLSSLKYLFLAGEPLDEPTAHWIDDALAGVHVIDNYWQTETGWPALTLLPGVDMKPVKFGSPGFPNLGYRMKVIDEATGEEVVPGQKGVLVMTPPLPPGCMSTIWNDDARFLQSYFSHFKELLYSSLDWAIRDEDGYTFILGRTDDVINVAGHRLGTREIEESVSGYEAVAEAAVIGVADELKGQVPIVFATLRQAIDEQAARKVAADGMRKIVEQSLGAVARPARVYIVNALPKTRSGKLLRRSLQALARGDDPGDLSTLDDPSALEEVRRALERGPDIGS